VFDHLARSAHAALERAAHGAGFTGYVGGLACEIKRVAKRPGEVFARA
jgi:hypothetical protein